MQPEINGDSLSRPLTLIDTGTATSLINENFKENLNKGHFSIKESRFKGIKGIGKNIIPVMGDPLQISHVLPGPLERGSRHTRRLLQYIEGTSIPVGRNEEATKQYR